MYSAYTIICDGLPIKKPTGYLSMISLKPIHSPRRNGGKSEPRTWRAHDSRCTLRLRYTHLGHLNSKNSGQAFIHNSRAYRRDACSAVRGGSRHGGDKENHAFHSSRVPELALNFPVSWPPQVIVHQLHKLLQSISYSSV